MAPPTSVFESSGVPCGIYCPTITFFKNDADQDLDLDRQAEHTRYILQSGVQGIVVHGTTGESVLLSHEERNTITRLVAQTRQELNTSHVSLVVGCPAQSTREVLKMCRDAKDNGGDFALVLPPSYWVKAVTSAVIEQFFREVADKAPLPIIIYSFPAVTAGVEMDSDLLAKLAKHPNIKGVKLTCGNIGKMTRLTSVYSPSEFSVFGGSTDWLVPGLMAKSCGAVTGLANTHPRSCIELFNRFQEGRYAEAVDLQGKLSCAEWAMGRTGMNGTKYAIEFVRNQGAKILPRRPLVECDDESKSWIEETMRPLSKMEIQLGAHSNGNGVIRDSSSVFRE